MAKFIEDYIIVTNAELGWDCVVGLYTSESRSLEEVQL